MHSYVDGQLTYDPNLPAPCLSLKSQPCMYFSVGIGRIPPIEIGLKETLYLAQFVPVGYFGTCEDYHTIYMTPVTWTKCNCVAVHFFT